MAWNKKQRLGVALLCIALASGIVIATKRSLLSFAGRILVRDDALTEPTEYLLLLMGDMTPMRAQAACDVVKSGLARTIVMAEEKSTDFQKLGFEPSHAEVHRQFLMQSCGIDSANIVIVKGCETTSTLEEGRCFKGYFDHLPTPPTHVVLVTGWYHTSRARWLIQSVLGDIRVEAKPATAQWSSPDDWWETEYSFLWVFEEYLKWTYWLLHR